jgi:hypothetical protein
MESSDQAVYVGRRVVDSGKVLQAFKINGVGDPIFFKGIQGVFLGYTYKFNKEKGTMAKRPERFNLPLIDNPEWEAADLLAEAKLKGERESRKLSALSKPRLRNAVESVRPLLKGLSYSQRSRLVNIIIDMAEIGA